MSNATYILVAHPIPTDTANPSRLGRYQRRTGASRRDLVRAQRAGGGVGTAQPLGPSCLLGLPKLQKAIKQGTKVISEAELLNLLAQ